MSSYELLIRFFLLISAILVLYFFSNRKDNTTINPLMIIVGLCTFSLCYLFTKIEIGIGIGFGLFAVFSILRFRAQTFTIYTMIFLFAIITLSILDIMCPFERFELLIFFQLIIVISYIIAFARVHLNNKKFSKVVDLKLNYDSDFELDDSFIKAKIQAKIKLKDFTFKVIVIDAVTNIIEIKVYY